MKDLFLTLAAFATILLVINTGYYKEWFRAKPSQYWSDFWKEKEDTASLDAIRVERYGIMYTVSLRIKEVVEQKKISHPVILFEPNSFYRDSLHIYPSFHAPEPAVFYYYTGLEGVWINSPDVTKANFLVRLSKKGVNLDQIRSPQQLQQILPALQKISSNLITICLFLAYFLLLCCFLLAGYGLLRLFRLGLKPAYTITLSLLLGIALASFLPFLLQLLYIPITGPTVFGSLLLVTFLLNIPTAISIRKEGFSSFRRRVIPARFRIRTYEIPYWMVLGFFIFVSVWRCYYYPLFPVTPSSGPEAIAEFTVREHTMVNSFFTIDLWSTNNQFKSPFLISLQVVYKLAGFPFGQVWLSIVFVCLTVFLYHALREKLHPLLAATLLLLFTMTPELYAYTFMILYDYSNMVYFFLGLYFLFQSIPSPSLGPPPPPTRGSFYLAGLLLGIATYIRSETLALAFLFLPLILLAQWRARYPFRKMVVNDLLFFLPALAGYYLPVQLYINHYLPVHYAVGSLINTHLAITGLFRRYADIFRYLLTGELSVNLWGYLFYLTAGLFALEAIFLRRFTRDARNWLYAIVVVYLGLGFIGWLLPVMDLTDSTKRGLFKMLPLAVLYMANNRWLLRLSTAISRWELTRPLPGPSGSPAAPAKTVLTKTGKTAVAQTGGHSRNASPTRNTPPTRNAPKTRRRKK